MKISKNDILKLLRNILSKNTLKVFKDNNYMEKLVTLIENENDIFKLLDILMFLHNAQVSLVVDNNKEIFNNNSSSNEILLLEKNKNPEDETKLYDYLNKYNVDVNAIIYEDTLDNDFLVLFNKKDETEYSMQVVFDMLMSIIDDE